jgi:hypothetical protein
MQLARLSIKGFIAALLAISLAACNPFAALSNSSDSTATTLPTPTPATGTTLTISGAIGNLTGLVSRATLTNTATAFYNAWGNPAGSSDVFIQYRIYTGYTTLSVSGTSDNGTGFWAGPNTSIICTVSGSFTGFSACSAWGITFSRSSGTVAFVNTPVHESITGTPTGAMNGALSFTPF